MRGPIIRKYSGSEMGAYLYRHFWQNEANILLLTNILEGASNQPDASDSVKAAWITFKDCTNGIFPEASGPITGRKRKKPQPIQLHKIRISALWIDHEVKPNGYIGAVLSNGIPVALCSKDRWDNGVCNSIRAGFTGLGRKAFPNHPTVIFPQPKILYMNVSEDQLITQGLTFLVIPKNLLYLVKEDAAQKFLV